MPAMKWKFFVAYWVPVIIWMALIFGVSSITGEDLENVSKDFGLGAAKLDISDVAYHTTVFAVLALVLSRALFAQFPSGGRLLWIGVASLSFVYGAGDELHQAFVPGRAATLLDMGYNLAGITGGLAIYRSISLARLVWPGPRID